MIQLEIKPYKQQKVNWTSKGNRISKRKTG